MTVPRFEKPPYYITAYGLAVKRGFKGTLDEWIASLTGDAATLVSKSVAYQSGDSGSIIPSGTWVNSVPVVSQGKYLWTKTELRFNTGDPIVSYSVARMGIDGTGSVSSVAGVSPDATGNVTLTAADVGALAVSGGDMAGAIDMNGQPISGLNDPTEDTQAARKVYVDTSVRKAAPRNLLDNSDWRVKKLIVNQRGQDSYTLGAWGGYTIDRWKVGLRDTTVNFASNGISLNGYLYQVIPNPEKLVGKILTLAAKINGVIYCGSGEVQLSGSWSRVIYMERDAGNIELTTQTDNSLLIGIDSSAGAIEWAALYEGEYTLDTLPEYQPKGYGAELAECRRYYRPGERLLCVHCVNGYYPIGRTLEMRTIPTCTIRYFSPYGKSSVTTFTNADTLNITGGSNGKVDIQYATLPSANQELVGELYVDLNADL